ncbi:AraC family transcriptional regulator [Flavobacterium silvisoli]|uniref:AraC family transcriptional regulator n=1 Tax=Flavobacterium silvisoli TaxID=2529433 RepID=UPI001386610C|nr:AraC family transcriptional regulator [Flavobacterium silvisoli]
MNKGISLGSFKNNDIKSIIYADSKDSIKSKQQLQVLINNSKLEANWEELAKAYRIIMYLSDKKWRMNYADSLLNAAKLSANFDLIGQAYLTRGILYYDQKEHKMALDNYILADSYLSQTKNQYGIYKVKFSIAHTKYYLGFYHEAIALFKECIIYFEQENDVAYLNSLHSIGLCYNKIDKYELCSQYNQLGLQKSKELGNNELVPYFKHSEGVNMVFKKKYQRAIKELIQVIPLLKNKDDFANQTVAWYYLGKSYSKLGLNDKAVIMFNKVDSIFVKYNYIRPDIRQNYEWLINYYKKKKDDKSQLLYINRLLKVDSILNHNYKYLSLKIFKEYDTKKLLSKKKDLEKSLESNNRILFWTTALLSMSVVLLSYRHYKNKKRYKLKFEELMHERNLPKTENHIKKELQSKNNITKTNELDINPELITVILQNLEKFERNKKYLEKDMSQTKLATHLKTNTKYASKIILKYRQKKTIEYINDLKIDHIIKLLQSENKYRNYTNKALAEEAGFGSTQNFTKAFNTKIGMPPTFFIRELKRKFPL